MPRASYQSAIAPFPLTLCRFISCDSHNKEPLFSCHHQPSGVCNEKQCVYWVAGIGSWYKIFMNSGIQMAQAVSRRPLTAETLVLSWVSPCEICGGQSGTATGFSPSTSVFPRQYHSTNAPNPFIHPPPTLYNVSLPVLSFPLSVSFHQCSKPIHSQTTHAV